MSGLLIVSDPERLSAAAAYFGGAAGPVAGASLPSLGDAGAEESMGRFAGAVGAYHAGLCGAAGEGARCVTNYRTSFQSIGT